MRDFNPLVCAVLTEGIVMAMCVAYLKIWRVILHAF
jgi:hypothetical protein